MCSYSAYFDLLNLEVYADKYYVSYILAVEPITAIIQSRHLSIFGHIAHMDDEWCKCQDVPNGSPSRELEETTRLSPYHVAEHHPTRPESLQTYTERSGRSGWEPPSVEADVYVWCYTFLVVHTRQELEMWANAQRDGRPAEHRWRPLFNAAKFGWRPLLDAVQ